MKYFVLKFATYDTGVISANPAGTICKKDVDTMSIWHQMPTGKVTMIFNAFEDILSEIFRHVKLTH